MTPTDAQRGREQSAPSSAASVASSVAPGSPAGLDFAAEYQKAYRVLWVVAAGVLGQSAGAEDVVQEAALLALKKVGQFEPGTHFAAWMAQMVRFVALNHARKQSRSHAAPLDENDPASRGLFNRRAATPPDDDLHLGRRGELPAGQRSFDDETTHALAGLSDVARACLLLRTLEGLDYDEIGRLLQIPQGTAMSHVHRSRMRLRERLMSRAPLHAGGDSADEQGIAHGSQTGPADRERRRS
jgi:RNA polymerase sigma-70 factor (ECF subfamily)